MGKKKQFTIGLLYRNILHDTYIYVSDIEFRYVQLGCVDFYQINVTLPDTETG